MRFTDKVAVVTGGGNGIGEAYVRALHAEGARVVIAELDHDAGQRVADDLGDRALAVRTDVGDQASTDAMAAAAVDAFGGIDLLVNNAAIFGDMEMSSLMKVDLDYLDRFTRVNLWGALHCARSCARSMRSRGGGAILNQSSTASWMSYTGFYGLTKSGLNYLTVALAQELGHHGIRVNAVAPGPTQTAALDKQVPDVFRDAILDGMALRRIGTPDDHVGPVLFLLSDDAAWVTGQIVAVDGGQIVRV